MSLALQEMTRRFEADEAGRLRLAWEKRMADALAAGQREAGAIPPPIPHSSDYWHREDGDDCQIYSPNPAMDLAETEHDFLSYAAEETGQSTTDEKQQEIAARRAEIEAQSHEIAERLETVGVSAYRQTPFGIWQYAIHSRTFSKVPAFRRICLLPYVAWMLRGPMVSALEYFLDKHPFCRFWTFTSGKRVPIRIPANGPAEPLLRQRIAYLNRKISQLNALPFMKRAGLEIVFRSDEFGTPETNENGDLKSDAGSIERDADGIVWLHVHAHCVVYPKKGFIPPKQWADVLHRVKAFWGDHWDEGGGILTARECCKYVTKPGEMLKLTPAELGEIYRQTRRMKLVQPLGALKAEIAERAAAGKMLRPRNAGNGEGRIYEVAPNHNKQRRRTTAQKDLEAGQKFDAKEAGDFFRIIARSAPSFCGAGLKECRVTIMSAILPDEARVRAHPDVARLIAATEDAWQAGLYIRVHTCTPTVGARPPPDTQSQRLLAEIIAR